MILIAAFLLGITFTSAGLIAKEINASIGAQIANRHIHVYLTWLGMLSNLILPILFIVMACTLQGVNGGVLTAVGLVVGTVVLGALRLPYPFRLLLAVFGVPLMAIFFIAGLFI